MADFAPETPLLQDPPRWLSVNHAVSAARGIPIPLVFLVAVAATALLAPAIAPRPPLESVLRERLLPPAWAEGGTTAHFLGTDAMGRDVLSRIIFGARISVTVSLIVVVLSGAVGVLVGLISGFYSGWVDMVLMRVVDVVLSLPSILIAILLAVTLGPGFSNVIFVIVLVTWARYARVIRVEALSIREQDFVSLARLTGCTSFYLMRRHIFPNLVPTLLVLITYQVGEVIILEAAMSFLGVGVPPPEPSWGVMIADGRDIMESSWWVSALPGLVLLLTVLSCNLLGDWIRDRLDPKLRQV